MTRGTLAGRQAGRQAHRTALIHVTFSVHAPKQQWLARDRIDVEVGILIDPSYSKALLEGGRLLLIFPLLQEFDLVLCDRARMVQIKEVEELRSFLLVLGIFQLFTGVFEFLQLDDFRVVRILAILPGPVHRTVLLETAGSKLFQAHRVLGIKLVQGDLAREVLIELEPERAEIPDIAHFPQRMAEFPETQAPIPVHIHDRAPGPHHRPKPVHQGILEAI